MMPIHTLFLAALSLGAVARADDESARLQALFAREWEVRLAESGRSCCSRSAKALALAAPSMTVQSTMMSAWP